MLKSKRCAYLFGKISLIGYAGGHNSIGLLEELVADGNQGHLAVFAFGHEAVVARSARAVCPTSGLAAPE